jgi:hypothetical protein
MRVCNTIAYHGMLANIRPSHIVNASAIEAEATCGKYLVRVVTRLPW